MITQLDVSRRSSKSSEGSFLEQKALLLQAWGSVLEARSAVYLSGPITTGPRFIDWARKSRTLGGADYAKELRTFVIEPNSRDIRETAESLRAKASEPVLEPATLYVSGWSQKEYLDLWAEVIEGYVKRLVMMPGWSFSVGCAFELGLAFERGIPVSTLTGLGITLDDACRELEEALEGPAADLLPGLGQSLDTLARLRPTYKASATASSGLSTLRKDESLDMLATSMNVAQFVSFSPHGTSLRQEFSRILDVEQGRRFRSVREALSSVLERSSEGTINLRSFTPDSPQSREFIYGIANLDEAESAALRLGSEGLFVIANETIDIHDGGVSGVSMGDVVEFMPDDTPRGVEKPGVASLPYRWAMHLLSSVYGFRPHLPFGPEARLEFSIHPQPRGWRHAHTIGWELGEAASTKLQPKLSWPNRFSQLVGDKVFGLLIAHSVGLPVPNTTVVNRRVAPFNFGSDTGSFEKWLRTSPRDQQPGKFTTKKGWADPFALLDSEDPIGNDIVSVLAQAAVRAKFSGAAIVTSDDQLVVEGVSGEGDSFMLGLKGPQILPAAVRTAVTLAYERAYGELGQVRFEWVFDGSTVWIVQLHLGGTQSRGATIVPGKRKRWVRFDTQNGLVALKKLIASIDSEAGILLVGDVGLTSHIADAVRKSGVPTRIQTGDSN